MSANLLNPVLFTVLGEPIFGAKFASVVGLGLDIWGVLLLLRHNLRTREIAVAMASLQANDEAVRREMFERFTIPGPTRYAEAIERSRREASDLLGKTQWGFRLLLAGFILQMLGALAS